MSIMLGSRLKRDRGVCRFGCCDRTRAPRERKTKNERARDERAWRKENDE